MKSKQEQIIPVLFLRKLGKLAKGNQLALLYSKIPILLSKYEILNHFHNIDLFIYNLQQVGKYIQIYWILQDKFKEIDAQIQIPGQNANLKAKNFIYILGGQNSLSQAYKINVLSQELIQLPNLLVPTYYAAAAYFKNEIYVIAGH